MGREDFKAISAHAKRATLKRRVVTFVLLGDQISDHLTLIVHFAHVDILGHGPVSFDRTDAVNTRHGRHDNNVITFQQRTGCRVAHTVNLLVNLALFFDVSIRARYIGFRLIVVIIADEILDGVIGKKALELPIKLGGQRFVRRKDDRGASRLLNHFCHGECFAGACCAKQHLIAVAVQHTSRQFFDGRGLVARGFKLGVELERNAALQLVTGFHVWRGICQNGRCRAWWLAI